MHVYIYMHTWAHSVRPRWYILWRKIKPEKGSWGLFNYRLNGLPTPLGSVFWTKPKCRQWSDGNTEDRSVEQSSGEGQARDKAQDGNVLGVLPRQQGGQGSCSSGSKAESRRLGGWRADLTGPWWTWQGFWILFQLLWRLHGLEWWKLLIHGLMYAFFFPIIFISWRLITLQYCSGFCHTLYACKDQSSCWVEKRWNMLEWFYEREIIEQLERCGSKPDQRCHEGD